MFAKTKLAAATLLNTPRKRVIAVGVGLVAVGTVAMVLKTKVNATLVIESPEVL